MQKKERFYYALYSSEGSELSAVTDSAAENVASIIESYDKVILTGKDSEKFLSKISSEEIRKKFVVDSNSPRNIASSLIELGLEKFERDGEDDIGEGPLYVRRSDAEEALLKKMEN